MILPDDYLVIVHDAPAEMSSRDLALWLHEIRAFDRVLFVNADERDEAIQHNYGVGVALSTEYDKFLFIESDMRPTVESLILFWASDADVVGADYETECLDPDGSPMHVGFYRTRREVLERIRTENPPCFRWPSNAQHTQTVGCLCGTFCRKVLEHGYTIEKAGFVGHTPKRKRRCKPTEAE